MLLESLAVLANVFIFIKQLSLSFNAVAAAMLQISENKTAGGSRATDHTSSFFFFLTENFQ